MMALRLALLALGLLLGGCATSQPPHEYPPVVVPVGDGTAIWVVRRIPTATVVFYCDLSESGSGPPQCAAAENWETVVSERKK